MYVWIYSESPWNWCGFKDTSDRIPPGTRPMVSGVIHVSQSVMSDVPGESSWKYFHVYSCFNHNHSAPLSCLFSRTTRLKTTVHPKHFLAFLKTNAPHTKHGLPTTFPMTSPWLHEIENTAASPVNQQIQSISTQILHPSSPPSVKTPATYKPPLYLIFSSHPSQLAPSRLLQTRS